jgi:hypothetical protein
VAGLDGDTVDHGVPVRPRQGCVQVIARADACPAGGDDEGGVAGGDLCR